MYFQYWTNINSPRELLSLTSIALGCRRFWKEENQHYGHPNIETKSTYFSWMNVRYMFTIGLTVYTFFLKRAEGGVGREKSEEPYKEKLSQTRYRKKFFHTMTYDFFLEKLFLISNFKMTFMRLNLVLESSCLPSLFLYRVFSLSETWNWALAVPLQQDCNKTLKHTHNWDVWNKTPFWHGSNT